MAPHRPPAQISLQSRSVSTVRTLGLYSSGPGQAPQSQHKAASKPFARQPVGNHLGTQSHPEATLKPSGSQPVGTRKPPSGYPEATPRLPLLTTGGSEPRFMDQVRQLRHRLNLQLGHDAGAVAFDRALVNAQVPGDLLVQLAGQD